MNYFIEDNPEFHKAAKELLTRKDWHEDVYRINVYALGEIWKNILMKLNFPSSDLSFENKLEKFKRQISDRHIEIFGFKDINSSFSDWVTHYKEIDKLDSVIQKADKFNLAFFCSDVEARFFYTFDAKIISSVKLSEYLKQIGKKIKDIH
ncbi:MAG: hypothetical protein QW046_03630 [Candidatus Micrarchaeaceae archaeon]